MKKNHGLLGLLFSFCLSVSQAQNNVGVNTTTPHASAALDVTSTTQGVLVPRMSQDQRNAINPAATGLLIYQTDNTPGFYYYSGSAWTAIAGSGGSGSLPSQTGNSGKALTTNGTTAAWTQVSSFMTKTTASQTVSVSSPNYVSVIGIPLEAGKTYFITGQIFGARSGASNAAMTVRLRYTGTGTTDAGGITYAGGSFLSGATFNNSGTHDTEAAGFGVSAATLGQRYEPKIMINATTAGTLYVEMARTTGNTTNDFYLSAGSYLIATPL